MTAARLDHGRDLRRVQRRGPRRERVVCGQERCATPRRCAFFLLAQNPLDAEKTALAPGLADFTRGDAVRSVCREGFTIRSMVPSMQLFDESSSLDLDVHALPNADSVSADAGDYDYDLDDDVDDDDDDEDEDEEEDEDDDEDDDDEDEDEDRDLWDDEDDDEE